MKKGSSPVEIADGIFWVGSNIEKKCLNCNSYLIIDNGEGILIDPGSVLDFEDVSEKVSSLISFSDITHIILHHQDADLCSSVPLFEKAGVKADIVLHWRTMLIVQYFGIRSSYYLINEHDFVLQFRSGRILEFIPTPYLHFAGAVATYDPESKILFSSDLFGAFSNSSCFWADSSYLEAMKAYHEHYMPSNDIIRPVMERFLTMDISIIAPQHGSLIRENIRDFIVALRDLECGSYLTVVKKQLGRDGNYGSICSSLMQRYLSLFPEEEICAVFEGTDLPFSGKGLDIIKCEEAGARIIDDFFDIIASKKGLPWLIPVEPLVTKIVKEYGIGYPKAFASLIRNHEKKFQKIPDAELLRMQFQETEKSLACNDLTGLHNDSFFRSFLSREVSIRSQSGGDFSVIFISIDNLALINNKLGKKTGDEILVHLTYLLKNFLLSGVDLRDLILFKAEGPWFAVFAPAVDLDRAADIADRIRVAVAQSSVFITNVTVSSGIVSFNEFNNPETSADALASTIHDAGMMKGRIAQKKGPGSIYCRVDENDFAPLENYVLVADPDTMNLSILQKELSDRGITAVTCEDGASAIAFIEKHEPQAIISEMMLPKIDAFRIKEQLNRSLNTKGIPFILLAHEKNEKLVAQSLSVGITYFFKKPCLPAEIAGIIQLLVSGV